MLMALTLGLALWTVYGLIQPDWSLCWPMWSARRSLALCWAARYEICAVKADVAIGARSMALRMVQTEQRLKHALRQQETLMR